MYINDEWLNTDRDFPVFNPANGEQIGSVPDGGRAEVARAIEAANASLPDWSAATAYRRSEFLYRAYGLVLERRQELAELMTREQGKPLKASLNEVKYAADFLLWFAEEAKRIYGETIPSARSDQRFLVLKQPVGVVAAITPWNYPISMLTRKMAPALAAGCTVVLKPAEATPLCAVAVFEILAEAGIPAGVVNLVTAADPVPVGEEFCTNPKVRKLTFTGSTSVGRKLARDAAPQLKRVSMELGGHAPCIVFDDADPVHAAKGSRNTWKRSWVASAYNGVRRASITRIPMATGDSHGRTKIPRAGHAGPARRRPARPRHRGAGYTHLPDGVIHVSRLGLRRLTVQYRAPRTRLLTPQ